MDLRGREATARSLLSSSMAHGPRSIGLPWRRGAARPDSNQEIELEIGIVPPGTSRRFSEFLCGIVEGKNMSLSCRFGSNWGIWWLFLQIYLNLQAKPSPSRPMTAPLARYPLPTLSLPHHRALAPLPCRISCGGGGRGRFHTRREGIPQEARR